MAEGKIIFNEIFARLLFFPSVLDILFQNQSSNRCQHINIYGNIICCRRKNTNYKNISYSIVAIIKFKEEHFVLTCRHINTIVLSK